MKNDEVVPVQTSRSISCINYLLDMFACPSYDDVPSCFCGERGSHD